jgi:hypothetical protein|nr:MAG TPA: hypothetical protein [Caudoviricetes sp.]
MEDEVIGIRNLDTGIGSAGVGFVVVPSEVDRVQYINDCYRTNTLTINGGKGYGYFSGVHADINVMQNIKFPTDEENRGTPVVWVKDAVSQLPVIVAVLRKQGEYYSLNENQFRLKRGTETRNVEIFIDGSTSALDITILGDKEEPANIDVKLSSENADSILTVSCDNEINIIGEKAVNVTTNKKATLKVTEKGEDKMSLSYELGVGLKYKDEFENEVTAKEGQVDVISKKINHNSGKEPMVLGNTLADLLNEFLAAVQKITVISPVGVTSVPVNIKDFAAIQAKLDTIKSQISNLE